MNKMARVFALLLVLAVLSVLLPNTPLSAQAAPDIADFAKEVDAAPPVPQATS